MNCHQFVVALLFAGLIAGCASTQIEQERTNNSISTDSETIVAEATNTATVTSTATPRPTDTPEEVLADTATPTSSPVPTQTALPLPSPLPTSTSTFTPTSIPVPTTVATADTAEDNRAGSQSVEYGLQVYKQQYCGVCHQFDLANTAGLFGPSQNGLGATAEQRIKDPSYTGQATTAEEYIRESILDPTAYYVKGYEQTRHHMPAFTHLSEAELDALVQMLLQQK